MEQQLLHLLIVESECNNGAHMSPIITYTSDIFFRLIFKTAFSSNLYVMVINLSSVLSIDSDIQYMHLKVTFCGVLVENFLSCLSLDQKKIIFQSTLGEKLLL